VKRTETRRSALTTAESKSARAKPNSWQRVFNDQKRRVRGLWRRNGVYYAQLNFNGIPTRFPLKHAATVPEAVTQQQVLKGHQRAGTLKRPSEQPAGSPAAKVNKRSIKSAIQVYQKQRNRLKRKDPKSGEREDSGLKKWIEFAGNQLLSSIDDDLRIEYAEWRYEQKELEGETISGRSIDLDIMAIGQVLKMAVRKKWLAQMPVSKWEKLAKKPRKKRLIETSELKLLCKTAIDECPLRGRLFADYLELLAYSGGREKETLTLEWEKHVHWKRRQFEFPGGKKGGGSQEAGEPRFIDFFPNLEAHLRAMFKRRDLSSPFLFPADDDPAQHAVTFKQIWKKVREKAKLLKTEKDIGFHHFRHYFISHCVMAGIDFMTIATWVGHRDKGILIGKVYGHLRPGHSANEAKKLATVKAWE